MEPSPTEISIVLDADGQYDVMKSPAFILHKYSLVWQCQ